MGYHPEQEPLSLPRLASLPFCADPISMFNLDLAHRVPIDNILTNIQRMSVLHEFTELADRLNLLDHGVANTAFSLTQFAHQIYQEREAEDLVDLLVSAPSSIDSLAAVLSTQGFNGFPSLYASGINESQFYNRLINHTIAIFRESQPDVTISATHANIAYTLEAFERMGVDLSNVGLVIYDRHIDSYEPLLDDHQKWSLPSNSDIITHLLEKTAIGHILVIGYDETTQALYDSDSPTQDIIKQAKASGRLNTYSQRILRRRKWESILNEINNHHINLGITQRISNIDLDVIDVTSEGLTAVPYSGFTQLIMLGASELYKPIGTILSQKQILNSVFEPANQAFKSQMIRRRFNKARQTNPHLYDQIVYSSTLLKSTCNSLIIGDFIAEGSVFKEMRNNNIGCLQYTPGGFSVRELVSYTTSLIKSGEAAGIANGVDYGSGIYSGDVCECLGPDAGSRTAFIVGLLADSITNP